MSPNPTALRSLVKQEEVDAHRCVLCSGYDDCLEAALHMSWRSWTCAQCEVFGIARLRAAERLHAVAARQTA